MKSVKSTSNKKAILAVTVERGMWRSNPAYRQIADELRFPPFDLIVMNLYHALVKAPGGFWKMKATSNGSFFLFPETARKTVEVMTPNGQSTRMSIETSGIIVTLFTLEQLFPCVTAAALFGLLLEYAQQQPEYSVIRSMIVNL